MTWNKTWPTEDGFYWLKTRHLEFPEVVRIDRGIVFITGDDQGFHPEDAEFFYPKLECPI